MSGWIDYYEDELICPFCGHIISIIFIEEGSAVPYEPIITNIAEGKAECLHCKNIITDQNLNNNNGGDHEENQ